MSRELPALTRSQKQSLATSLADNLSAQGITDIFWDVDYTLTNAHLFHKAGDHSRGIGANDSASPALLNFFAAGHRVEEILCDKDFTAMLLYGITSNGIKNHAASQSFSEHINTLFSKAGIKDYFTSITGRNELRVLGIYTDTGCGRQKFLKMWDVAIKSNDGRMKALMIDDTADEILAVKSFFDSLEEIRANLYSKDTALVIINQILNNNIQTSCYSENKVITKETLFECISSLLTLELIKIAKSFDKRIINSEILRQVIADDRNAYFKSSLIQQLQLTLGRVSLANSQEINELLGSLSPQSSIDEGSLDIGFTAKKAIALNQIIGRQSSQGPQFGGLRAESTTEEPETHPAEIPGAVQEERIYGNIGAGYSASRRPTMNLSGAASEAIAVDDYEEEEEVGVAPYTSQRGQFATAAAKPIAAASPWEVQGEGIYDNIDAGYSASRRPTMNPSGAISKAPIPMDRMFAAPAPDSIAIANKNLIDQIRDRSISTATIVKNFTGQLFTAESPQAFETNLCALLDSYCGDYNAAVTTLNSDRAKFFPTGKSHTPDKQRIIGSSADLCALLKFAIRALPILDEALEKTDNSIKAPIAMQSIKLRESINNVWITITKNTFKSDRDFFLYNDILAIIENFKELKDSEKTQAMKNTISHWINAIEKQIKEKPQEERMQQAIQYYIRDIRRDVIGFEKVTLTSGTGTNTPSSSQTYGGARTLSSNSSAATLGATESYRGTPAFLGTQPVASSAPAALGARSASTADPIRQAAASAPRRATAVTPAATTSRVQAFSQEPISRAPISGNVSPAAASRETGAIAEIRRVSTASIMRTQGVGDPDTNPHFINSGALYAAPNKRGK